MRSISVVLFTAVLSACGSSSATDTARPRYNFAVVDGRNQISAAGDASLPNRITSQLTRDPQGKFSVLDFLLPTKAYAQAINLAGDPVVGAIVCGREAAQGEPQVQPLCAFTLADGKAANTVVPGTKAGTYNIVFTAQVQSQEPVKDSTTVIVGAGPMASTVFSPGHGFHCWTLFPAINVQDEFGNAVPYRFVTQGVLAHVGSDVLGAEGARTLIADGESRTSTDFQPVNVEVAGNVIATGKLTVPNLSAGCVSIDF